MDQSTKLKSDSCVLLTIPLIIICHFGDLKIAILFDMFKWARGIGCPIEEDIRTEHIWYWVCLWKIENDESNRANETEHSEACGDSSADRKRSRKRIKVIN